MAHERAGIMTGYITKESDLNTWKWLWNVVWCHKWRQANPPTETEPSKRYATRCKMAKDAMLEYGVKVHTKCLSEPPVFEVIDKNKLLALYMKEFPS